QIMLVQMVMLIIKHQNIPSNIAICYHPLDWKEKTNILISTSKQIHFFLSVFFFCRRLNIMYIGRPCAFPIFVDCWIECLGQTRGGRAAGGGQQYVNIEPRIYNHETC
ncbi:hypothetical protein ACJX0J_014361, partial [Zea mays]